MNTIGDVQGLLGDIYAMIGTKGGIDIWRDDTRACVTVRLADELFMMSGPNVASCVRHFFECTVGIDGGVAIRSCMNMREPRHAWEPVNKWYHFLCTPGMKDPVVLCGGSK